MLLNRRKKGGKKNKGVCFHEASIHDTLGNGFGHGSFVCLFCLFVWILFVGQREGIGFLMCV
jgi:hypothetical protein